MARLVGKWPGKILAIRADIDALPIKEENTFEYVSTTPGIMHACGHDGHTAILLGTAKILSGLLEEIGGEVRFLFQHGEESYPGGAQEMVAAGVMDGVDYIIGIHLLPQLEVGKVGIIYGPMTASADHFICTIHGKGGHAAMPHETIDCIAIASQIVTNLQHIISRGTDPLNGAVISVTKFNGGTSLNILPQSVQLGGSTRTLHPDLRNSMKVRMENLIKGITDAHGASYQFEYVYGYDPVINDKHVTKVIEETVCKVFGSEALELRRPIMASDDFSAFQRHAPGTYFWVGAGNMEKGIIHPLHHPRFTIDEEALEIGVKMFIHTALKLLENR
jgi:amidohydrolase